MIWLSLIAPIINGVVTAYNKSKDVTIATVQASVGIATAQAQYMTAVLGHRRHVLRLCGT